MELLHLVMATVVVTPCILLYFVFLRGADRYEPEPLWLLLALLAWGAVGATVPALGVNRIGESAVRLALDAGADEQLVMASTASFVAPVVEESLKALGLLLLWYLSARWLKELDGPLDGAIFGGAVGLGFTLTEDVLCLAATLSAHGTEAFGTGFVVRTLLSGLSHATFTALTGLGIGLAVEARSRVGKLLLPFGGWLAAVGVHAAHNLLVTFLWHDGLGLLLRLVLFWIFDLLFFVLVVLLILRDRRLILEALAGEVGTLITATELRRTVSLWMLLPWWNLLDLASSPSGYRCARQKQLALVELALLKRRRRRGETGLDETEHDLRHEIAAASRNGVLLG